MRLIPAILEKTTIDLLSQIDKLAPYFNEIHIDIADGQFVPNKTVQIEDMKNLPWPTKALSFDFHLMVTDWPPEIIKLKNVNRIKIKTILVHLQSNVGNRHACSLPLPGVHFGLVLNPEDEVTSNWTAIKPFPAVQIMSVTPGFQGAAFLPQTLDKINQLRRMGFKGEIYLDGGINDQTFPLILKNTFKPDVLCVGSYFKQDPKARLEQLTRLTKRSNG